MADGYVKLWRKSLESSIFTNPTLWYFWCWCLMKAAHKETKTTINYKELILQPGQFVFGRNKASAELAITEQTIRTCLSALKSTSRLTIKSTNRYSIITIVNWHSYQGNGKTTNHQINQQINQQLTSSQPATNHIQEGIKNVKKKTLSLDSTEYKLADLLLELITKRNPNHKQPNLRSWAKEIDLMIRADNRTPEAIEQIIKLCQADPFWQNNILSTKKLREQFDRLSLKFNPIVQGDTNWQSK